MINFTRKHLYEIQRSLSFEPVDEKTCKTAKALIEELVDDSVKVDAYIEDGRIYIKLGFSDPQDATAFVLKY